MAASASWTCLLVLTAASWTTAQSNRIQGPSAASFVQQAARETAAATLRGSHIGLIFVLSLFLFGAIAALLFLRERNSSGSELREKGRNANVAEESEATDTAHAEGFEEAHVAAATAASPETAEDACTLAEIANLMEECREQSMGADDTRGEFFSQEVAEEVCQASADSVMEAVEGTDDPKSLSLSTAATTLGRLGAWVHRAREAARLRMAKEEFELTQVRLITEDQLPPAEDRVYPRPNLIKYKWVLCTCFEHDWKLLRPKLLRSFFSSEEECEVMERHLFRKYMWVMPLYRKLSSEDCNDRGSVPDDISMFGVSKRSAASLLGSEGIGIMDKTFSQAEIGKIYTQANVTRPEETEGFQVLCRQQLARYQFAEFLLRVANVKWHKLTKVEALDRLFKELAVQCEKYSSDIRKLLSCGSDDVVQDTFVRIHSCTRAVFDAMASLHETKYAEKLMTLEDWRHLLNKASVFEQFPVIKRREVGYTYRMGLEAGADEQYNKTWQLLRYEDFQRALGAVIFLNEIRSKPDQECAPSTLASRLETFANEHLRYIRSN